MRRLREAQRGDPLAAQELLRPYLPGIWTLVRRMYADHATALAVTVSIRDSLRAQVRSFTVEDPFGAQLYRLVWRHLMALEEPNPSLRIPQVRLEVRADPARQLDEAAVARALQGMDPFCRLVYLFWAITGLSAPRLAELTGQPEARIRAARAATMACVLEATR